MKMMNRSRNRTLLAGGIAILAGIVIIFVLINTTSKKVVFQYKGKEAVSGELEAICGNEVTYDVSSVQLKATYNGEDITSEIQMEERKDGNRIIYKVRDQEFTLTILYSDTELPSISGPNEITIYVNEAFDASAIALAIRAQDTCDGNLDDIIQVDGSVDMSVIGDTTLTYKVSDQAGNEAKHTLLVHVVEKKAVNEPEQPSGSNQNGGLSDIIYHDGIADPRSITPDIVTNTNDYSILINKFHALQDGWEPNDLTTITSNNGRHMQLRSEAAEAWERLNAKAVSDGILIKVISSYRTQIYQAGLFNGYLAQDAVYAFKYSAMPRRSEHEYGVAIDISYDDQLYLDLQEDDIGKWMQANAAQFGFILRYPQGKEASTQYAYEAWHYRYVGVDLAKILTSRGMTLEEYYGE